MHRQSGLTRREFMLRTALSAPALAAVSRTPGFAGAAAVMAPASSAAAPRTAAPLRVIVVGAGLAGLAAAYELNARGHDVTVLEAQLRPGGRVYTLRSPFADGLYAEAGAVDFGNGYRHLLHYVKVFNLATGTQEQAPSTICHLRGKRFEIMKDGKRDLPYELSAEEKQLGLRGMFEKYFGVASRFGDPTDESWQIERFKAYDGMTLAEHMKASGASNEAITMFSSILGIGYGWTSGSALHRLVSDFALFFQGGPSSHAIVGGNDLLPQAFARSLQERIYYGSPVVKIIHESGGVRVVCRQSAGERTLVADRVICAVPCPVLRKIELTPALPARKRQILEQLEYTPVTRVYVQSRRRLWAEGGAPGRIGDAITDLPVEVVTEYPLFRSADQGPRAILESMTRGPAAVRVASWTRPAQLAFAIENFEKLYPGFGQVAEGGYTVDWAADPWAGGGYAWWKPGQLTEWMPELARPEGRLHFAGEHTSALGRTMEGALMSGNRAAREVEESAELGKSQEHVR